MLIQTKIITFPQLQLFNSKWILTLILISNSNSKHENSIRSQTDRLIKIATLIKIHDNMERENKPESLLLLNT